MNANAQQFIDSFIEKVKAGELMPVKVKDDKSIDYDFEGSIITCYHHEDLMDNIIFLYQSKDKELDKIFGEILGDTEIVKRAKLADLERQVKLLKEELGE